MRSRVPMKRERWDFTTSGESIERERQEEGGV